MAVFSGQTRVPSAGTPVRLHSDMSANTSVLLRALNSNTGAVYVGNVNGSVNSLNGVELNPGESLTLRWVGNLNQVWLDAGSDGDGVAWIVLVF